MQAPISSGGAADQRIVVWNLDDDPELSDLILRATADTQDLRELFARRQAALASVCAARAGLWPLGRVSMRSQRTKTADREVLQREAGDVGPDLLTLVNPSTRHALGAEVSCGIDLWSRLRSALTAATADLC